ncbi:MAG: type II toxin-antitoxin system VapC family toxin [Gemmatimonadota bacterium]
MLVLDASATIELLLDSTSADRIRERLSRVDESLHAPHVLDLEVAQVMRRMARLREVSPARARGVLDDLAALALTRYPHTVLLARIWQLRHTVSAYDAAYVTLAEVLAAPLLTRDARLASTRGHDAVIVLI